MATYLWSSLVNGSTTAFNAATDVLSFDDASISAADSGMVTWTGNDITFSVSGKSIAALNKTVIFTVPGGGRALTDTNVTYVNGSKLLIGDNSPSVGDGIGTFDDAANVLTGGAGNDRLISLGGNDTLNGGGGNDVLILNNGSRFFGTDFVDGGAGLGDSIGIGQHPSILHGATIDFTTHMVTSVDGTASFTNVENAFGTSFADIFIATDPSRVLTGLAAGNFDYSISMRGFEGNDTFFGDSRAGYVELVTYSDSPSGVVVNLATGVATDGWDRDAATPGVQPYTDTLVNIDLVQGSAFDDVLLGGGPALTFSGNRFEQFEGMAGNDTIDANGGPSSRATYANSPSAVTVNLATGTASDGWGGTDTLIGIAGVQGSVFNDTITGDAKNNFLEGRAGNDTIDGGLGFDIIFYQGAFSAVTIDLATGTSSLTGGLGTDTWVGIEAVRGGDFGDTLLGDAFGNNLEGLAGADQLDGRAGNDRVIYNRSISFVDVNLATGLALDGYGFVDNLVSIENVRASKFNDTITGNASNNEIEGWAGNDTIIGGGGFDRADYFNSLAAVTVNLATGIAIDGWGGVDSLTGIEGVIGSAFNDSLTGDAADNFLRGGLGADFLNGGAGHDYADYITAAAGLTVDLGNTANNTGDAVGDTYVSIERVRGSNFNDILVGDTGNNTLRGGFGADILNGGAGGDFASYSDSSIGITVDLGNTANNTAEAVGDTYISIENLRGGDFNDSLTGDAADNFLNGGPGADALFGGAGNDYADYINSITPLTVDLGNPGNNSGEALGDTYFSIERVRGSAFNDILVGNNFSNVLRGGLGADVLNGGGSDFDFASYSDSTVGLTADLSNSSNNTGEAAGDTYVSIDSLRGGNFNDVLIGDGETNFLNGGPGGDVLNGGGDIDIADYFNATTALSVDLSNPDANSGEAAGDSYVLIEGIRGGAFNDILTGDAGDNILFGGDGADVLIGGAGLDLAIYFRGNSGTGLTVNLANPLANTGDAVGDRYVSIEGIAGSFFNDVLTGDARDNVLQGDEGADVLNGGAGEDFAAYFFTDSAVTVSLENPVSNTGQAAGDTFTSIEGIIGTGANDTLTGDAANNVLAGGGGSDVLNGGSGFDYTAYFKATAAVTVNLGNSASNTGDAAGDTFTSIEGVIGSAFNDVLFGDAGDNILRGRAGSDVLSGGAGFDIADYRSATTGIKANLSNAAGNSGDEASGDSYSSIEGLRGGAFDDHLSGDANANSFDGGGGFDIVSYRGAAGAVIADLSNAASNTGEAAGDTYTSIEALAGSAFNDTLTGDAGSNDLSGGAGADVLNGGDGFDFADYEDASAGVTANLTTPASNTGDAAGDTYSSIEGIIGSNFADTLTGNAQTNVFFGGLGNDRITGNAGTDTAIFTGNRADYTLTKTATGWTVSGIDGVDTLIGMEYAEFDDETVALAVVAPRLLGDGADIELGTATADVIDGGGGDDQISGGAGADKLLGGLGNDTLDGGTGNDQLNGGVGDDILIGGAGNNLLDGGSGSNDEARFEGVLSDYRIAIIDGPNTSKLFFTLNGLEPGDIVAMVSKDGRVNRMAGVEKVKFLGDDSELSVNTVQLLKNAPVYVGTKYFVDKDNLSILKGSAGDDVIDGLEGNDALTGLAGNDVIDGGTGNDAMAGGLGNDTYVVDSLGDTVVELLTQGTADLIKTTLASMTLADKANVEKLEYMGTESFTGTGNGLGNTLKGGAGNDTLDGGAGVDRLEGGAGDDTYVVDRAANLSIPDAPVPGDVVFEGTLLSDSGGTDTVNASVTYTLGVNLENLRLTGTANVGGTGNTKDNVITGNDGNNALSGMDGNDTLNGGLGNDTLTGGNGNDTFIASAGNDIYTGGAGNDTLDLSSLPFTFDQKGKPGGFTVERPDASTVVITDVDTLQKVSIKGAWGAATGDKGIETFVFSDQPAVTLADLIANTASAFIDTYTGTDEADTFDGTAGNDAINGGAGNDTLTGGAGDDLLNGGTDDDAMTGGLGNDTYLVDSTGDTVTELLNQGTADLVKTTLATYLLGSHVERLEFTGIGNFSGTGNGIINTLKGGAGDDFLDGGAAADRLEGGAGNDTYVVDGADVVFEGATVALDTGGTDTVNALVNYTLGVNLENLLLTGTANLGTGNARNNTLTGNAGNNVLSGLGGNDTFFTSTGTDTFVGGLDNDTLNLSSLTFTFADKSRPGGFTVERPDAATVVITDLDTSQKFIVRGVESFVFSDQTVTLDQLISNTASAFNDPYLGTEGADQFDGLAGNDTINGGAGNDVLIGGAGDDEIDGGTGDDAMSGGLGNDTYFVDSLTDTVTELLNQGTADLVKTALSALTLADHVDRLEYTGSANFAGTGNGLINTIIGGAFDDTLDGGDGADTLRGQGGNDTYLVGAGDIVFEGTLAVDSGGTDTVNASVSYALVVNVENLVLTGALNLNGTGNAQANTLTGNDGNNTLSGLGDNDTLNGGLGNDRLSGGAGADQFDFTTVLDALTNVDTITDFLAGTDRIRLEADIFTGLIAGALDAGAFRSAAGMVQELEADDRIIYNSTTGALYYDADGSGDAAQAIQFAILSTHPAALSAADFSIV